MASNPFVKLLGEKVLGKDGSEVSVADLSTNEVVGFYFSAHWCPPCRGFTPFLCSVYSDLRSSGKKFEVVFISSDKDQSAFDGYYGEMPWLALPFANRKLKAKLSSKYGVQGIPTLVLFNSEAKVITKEGRGAVQEPENFPWKQPPFAEMLGDSLITNDGTKVAKEHLQGKYLGLYFSASWCPPCRRFSPVLCETYNKIKAKRNDVEFIFVSSDQDEKSFKAYFHKMPFLALPFDCEKQKNALSSFFEVEGIPTFVIVDPNGQLITADARSAVMEDQEGANFPWFPKAVKSLSSPDGINDKPSLVILAEGESKEQQEKFEKILFAIAEEEKARAEATGGELEMLFFLASEDDQVAQKIRFLTKVGDVNSGEESKETVCDGDVCHVRSKASTNTQVVLVNIADEGSYYVSEGRTKEEIEKFVGDFLGERLVAKHFGE